MASKTNQYIELDELQKIADGHEDVSSSVFLVADDNSSAKIVMRHGNLSHTVVLVKRDSKGQLNIVRSDVVAKDEQPNMDKPASADAPKA